MTACIVGWSHLPFGKHQDASAESMVVEAARAAIADAGLEAAEIDEIFLGHFNGGFVAQDFTSSLVLQADPALRFKPATRVENACATGTAAVHQGVRAIEAKAARIVLVVGVEKMTELAGPAIGETLLRCAYVQEEKAVEGGFAGVFGQIAQSYFQRFGDQSDALAAISARAHRNGCANPYAQIRKDLGFDFCRNVSEKNPIVAGPLKRTDCSLVTDGAAALVLADIGTALRLRKAVAFRAHAQVSDFLPMSRRDVVQFEGCTHAWGQALQQAQLELADLDLVETHDCFTIAELLEYEAMGLTEQGQGSRAVLEGWTEKDGRLPINPSGGLKAKGHPIGATGVSMHVLTAMQVRGEAGGMQVEGAKLGGIYNMGGACVASYVSILEPLR
ncbi:MAG: acetyl-CoA acetyltransferase [Geminicoccaceae bacterium]